MKESELQSKATLVRLWKGIIDPLKHNKGGGAKLLGFYFLDEFGTNKVPDLEDRGDTLFLLLPTLTRNVGHWCCITRKSKVIKYFDPAIRRTGNIPEELKMYLDRQTLKYSIDRSSPQRSFDDNGCGLYCIGFLKREYV